MLTLSVAENISGYIVNLQERNFFKYIFKLLFTTPPLSLCEKNRKWTYFMRNDYSRSHSERSISFFRVGRHRPILSIGNQSIGMERHSKSNFMGAKITSRGFAAPHISRNFREITKIVGVTFRSVFFLWIKTGQNHQHYVKVHVPEMKKYCDTFLWVSIQKKVRVDWKLRNHR